jgi:shikimate 5-dehydrogenase
MNGSLKDHTVLVIGRGGLARAIAALGERLGTVDLHIDGGEPLT